jgi:hypothetical protein
MAASFNESQKLDYLWKKVGYGVAKTSIPPPGSGSKEAFNESIASPLLYRGDLVWSNSGDIPSSPPSSTTSIVEVYKDGVGSFEPTVQCTEDFTAPDNQTWKTNLTNWIPTQFGDNYLVLVYVDTTGSTTPQTTGTRLFQAGSGFDDTWFFDYQAGILNFNGATIPSVISGGVTGKSVFIVGYRYVGPFGVGGQTGNITFSNTTISSSVANATITIQPTGTGIVTIDTTTGLLLPVGNTAQEPNPAIAGTIRYNTDTPGVEVYIGNAWQAVGGATYSITSQTISSANGSTSTFTLDQATDAERILVAINGLGQNPNINYTVAGDQITFSEAPQVSDIIEIRYISPAPSSGAVNSGVQYHMSYYATTGSAVSDTGANLTWNGTNLLSVGGAITATGNVSVGGNLTITGGIRKSARVLTTTTALTIADASGFIEFNSGPYTVTLPDPTLAANSGIGYRFWQNTASNITLSTPAGGFYGPSGNSGASTKVLAQATTQYWDVWSDGYNWAVFGIKTV